MKRQGNLFEKVYDIENIKLAICMAAKGKRSRKNVQTVLDNLDYFAMKLQEMLMNREYEPTISKTKEIYCITQKKSRCVVVPDFYPDLCIQWALILQLEPIIQKGMYYYSCGSLPNKGIHFAKRHIEKWLTKDRRNTKYCLQLDIKKYFNSINCGFLKNMFRKKIKDANMLWLIDTIIDCQDKGVPMGYFTSTWFANFFLQELDHYIKEKLGIVYYVRYVDDMVLFGRNKKELHKARKLIAEFLKNIGLELKSNWQVYRVDKRAVDFLGYRYFRGYTLLRKSLALRIKRKVKRISKMKNPPYKNAAGIMSYLGWTKHCNAYNYYNKNIKPYLDMVKLKEVIRNESRKQQQTFCLSN